MYFLLKCMFYFIACNCNANGTVGGHCNNITGKCECLDGWFGTSCEKGKRLNQLIERQSSVSKKVDLSSMRF